MVFAHKINPVFTGKTTEDLLGIAEELVSINPDSAQLIAFSALKHSTLKEDNYLISKSLNLLGLSYFYLRNLDSAHHYFQSSYKVATLNNVHLERANAMRYTGHIALMKGSLDEADSLYNGAMTIYESLGDSEKMLAAIYSNKGLLLNRKGDYNGAISFYDKSIKVSLAISDMEGVLKTLVNKGVIRKEQGKFSDAVRIYFRGVELADSLHHEKYLGFLYNNIGVIYKNVEEYKTALEYFSKSLIIKQGSKDRYAIAKTLGNIGLIHKSLEDYNASLNYINQALGFFIEIKDSYEEASSRYNLGNIYLLLEEKDSAMNHFNTSLEIAKKKQYKDIEGDITFQIGKILLKENKDTEARKKIFEAYELASNIGSNELIRDTSFDLYLIEKKRNHYKKALEFHEYFEKAEASILNVEIAKDIMRQEAKHQLAKVKVSSEETNEEFKHEINKKSMQNNLLLLLISMVVVVLLLVYRLFLVSKKAEKNLNKKNTLVATQNKRLQNQQRLIVDFNRKLEEQVDQRTQEIESKNKKLEEFAFINSHKLRKHLASILGLVNIIKNEKTEDELSVLISSLDKSAKSMDKVIHEINDIISKLDKGRGDVV